MSNSSVFNLIRSIFSKPSPASLGGSPDPNEVGGLSSMTEKYYDSMKLGNNIIPDYDFYSEMDHDEIISSIMDAYAEDSTQINFENSRTVWCESSNADIEKIIHDLFDEINLEEIIYSIVREIAKNGNDFEEVHGGFNTGVQHLNPLSVKSVRRIEKEGRLEGFNIGDNKDLIVPPSQMLHFRLLSRNRRSPYGDSMLWNARLIYRKIKWIEDAVVLYRLRRAPDRTVWYIDTGDVGPQEQLRLANKWRRTVKKNLAEVPGQGLKQDLRILAADQDIFFPKNKNNDSKIEQLSGSANVGDIWDLEYFLNKLFGSMRAPKAYFGFEGEIDAKASLVQQDFKFARGCCKLQRAALTSLAMLSQIHLVYKRIDPFSEDNKFVLRMSPVSYLEEQYRQEITNLRIDTADKLIEMGEKLGFKKDEWISHVLRKFGGFSQPELDNFMSSNETKQLESLNNLLKNGAFKNKLHRRLKESTDNSSFVSTELTTKYHLPVK